MGGTLIPDSALESNATPTQSHPSHRLIIVPQQAQPSAHPDPPTGFVLVTEFFVERCLHKRRLFDPRAHPLGRPFAAFPLPSFERLVICTGGFAGVGTYRADGQNGPAKWTPNPARHVQSPMPAQGHYSPMMGQAHYSPVVGQAS